jgi:hypothetical protein
MDEIPSNPPVPMEPVEFIDVARPRPNDPANRRVAPAIPTGWGFALFSPDSQSVATVSVADGAESKGEVLVWNVADLKPGSRFESPHRIAVVGISPEGKRIAIGPQGPQSGLPIIDLTTGQMAQTLPGPVARTNLVVWSPDGKQLVLGSSTDKTIRVWNVAEKKFIKADLTYLTRVTNEAMRLNPVIAGVFRELYQDVVHDGMLLPKGSTVMMHFYTMCHSHISQPDEFLPDRWDEAHPEYALLKSLFVPFSVGKRNCIGMNLALLETRCDFYCPFSPCNHQPCSLHIPCILFLLFIPTESCCLPSVDRLLFRCATKTILLILTIS